MEFESFQRFLEFNPDLIQYFFCSFTKFANFNPELEEGLTFRSSTSKHDEELKLSIPTFEENVRNFPSTFSVLVILIEKGISCLICV
jgi:hypothetical protein